MHRNDGLVDGPFLEGDVTWTLACSPYSVTGDVELFNSTLTIEAGVEVRFAEGAKLHVPGTGVGDEGAIIAQGTAAKPITFTAEGAGRWEGLSLSDSLQSTTLSHVVFEHCGAYGPDGTTPLTACLTTSRATDDVIALENMTFDDAVIGLRLGAGRPSDALEYTGRGALTLRNTGANVSIANSVFRNNEETDLWRDCSSEPSLVGNQYQSSGGYSEPGPADCN